MNFTTQKFLIFSVMLLTTICMYADVAWVSVKDYGAVGDGTTDDTMAIQTAIDTGKTVFLPEGNYRITSALNGLDYTHILGANRFKSTLIPNGCDGLVFDQKYHFLLENFSIRGSDSSNRSGSGLVLRNLSANFIVSNVNIRFFNTGIDLHNVNLGDIYSVFIGYNNTNVKMNSDGPGYGCHAIAFWGGELNNCNTGLWVKNGSGSKLIGVTIEQCTQYGIYFESGERRSFDLKDCYFEHNLVDIYALALSGVRVDNCYFDETGKGTTGKYIVVDDIIRSSIINCTFSESAVYNHIEKITGGTTPIINDSTIYANNVVDGTTLKINSVFTDVLVSQGSLTTSYIRNNGTEYSAVSMGKVSKSWSTTHAVTLQNSWTGTLLFSKNDLGEVWLRGCLAPGIKTFGTIIGTLPTEYLPTYHVSTSSFTSTGTVISGITILSDGSIRVYGTAASGTYPDCFINILFK